MTKRCFCPMCVQAAVYRVHDSEARYNRGVRRILFFLSAVAGGALGYLLKVLFT